MAQCYPPELPPSLQVFREKRLHSTANSQDLGRCLRPLEHTTRCNTTAKIDVMNSILTVVYLSGCLVVQRGPKTNESLREIVLVCYSRRRQGGVNAGTRFQISTWLMENSSNFQKINTLIGLPELLGTLDTGPRLGRKLVEEPWISSCPDASLLVSSDS